MQKIVVFDLDKTLTFKDTLLGYLKFCAKSRGKSLIMLRIMLWHLTGVFYKLNLINNDKLKKCAILLFLQNENRSKLESLGKEYCQTIQLNDIYYQEFLKFENPIVISASFEEYVVPLFPQHRVFASKIDYSSDYEAIGLLRNCFGIRKVDVLKSVNIDKVDLFYTDSFSDRPLMDISNRVYLVKGNKAEMIRYGR